MMMMMMMIVTIMFLSGYYNYIQEIVCFNSTICHASCNQVKDILEIEPRYFPDPQAATMEETEEPALFQLFD